MTLFSLHRFTLGSYAAASALAACAGQTPSSVPVQQMNTLPAYLTDHRHYKSLYSFKGSPDGAQPFAGLVALTGALYGTTYGGGGYHNPGTVFRITKDGKETVLFSFAQGSQDGYYPASGLIALKGILYGVAFGGTHNSGIVYDITVNGQETVLHDFEGKPDGENPDGNVIAVNGKLYGLTEMGGSGRCLSGRQRIGCGVVFEVSTSGKERVIYSFKGGSDGQAPAGTLVRVNDTLYGTTWHGGDESGCSGNGCGTVFSVTTSGKESVLYRFKGPPGDAEYSNGLVRLNNVLYGTAGGGTNRLGAVFAATLSGTETILHNFAGGADGANPSAPLEVVNGLLYGTTTAGGTGTCYSEGCGTVYKISTAGAEQVLYRFRGSPDGSVPFGNVTPLSGKLYGTTKGGGTENDGTVFRMSP